MENNEFVIFKRFSDSIDAQNLCDGLTEAGIDFQLIDNSPEVDLTFTGGNMQDELIVKLRKESFPQAQKMLEKQAQEAIAEVPNDYYIYDFTNDELMDIIKKPDEWSSLDFQLAKKILNEKKIKLSEADIEEFKKERNIELSKPEKGSPEWLLAAYIMAFLGGILGIVIGLAYWKTTRTTIEGDKIYTYDEITRKRGRSIVNTGVIMLIIWLIVLMIL